jgi:hypothetical protein
LKTTAEHIGSFFCYVISLCFVLMATALPIVYKFVAVHGPKWLVFNEYDRTHYTHWGFQNITSLSLTTFILFALCVFFAFVFASMAEPSRPKSEAKEPTRDLKPLPPGTIKGY